MRVVAPIVSVLALVGVSGCGWGEAHASGASQPTPARGRCPSPDPSSVASSVRVGIVSDTHGGSAFLPGAIGQMTCWAPHLLAHCGDIVYEQADYAAAIAPILAAYQMPGVPRALVLGNHDVNNAALTIEGIRAAFPSDASSWLESGVMWGYIDLAGVRFIVLDATYQSTEPATRTGLATGTNEVGGYIPAVELEWLAATIDASPTPCVILMHQPLAIDSGVGMVSNAAAVRAVLEARREKIAAVVNGHNHRPQHAVVGGVSYFTANATTSPFEVVTPHDRGLHQRLEVDTGARIVRWSVWEDDSARGYAEVQVIEAVF